MTSPTTRRRRGAATQALAAAYLREHGFPWATDAGAGRGGVDVLNVIGMAIEVKARRAFNPLDWLRQTRRNAALSELPVVIFRCDGQGPGTVAEWPVLLRLTDFTALARAAGYGEPIPAASSSDSDSGTDMPA